MTITPAIAGTLILALLAAVFIACVVIRRWPHDSTNDEEW